MATVPAVLGAARLGNFRLAYLPADLRAIRETRVSIWLDGVLARHRVRYNSIQIRDVLNDEPNTCTLTIEGAPAPASGQALRITLNSNAPRLLFNGAIQVEGETYQGRPDHVAYPCSGIDDHGPVNARRPFGLWVTTSASTIAAELITRFAPSFSTAAVQPGLAAVTFAADGTERLTECLRRLAKLVGGYFYVEDRVLHFFLDETSELPDPIDGAHPPLDYPAIARQSDDSQVRTRVYGRGHQATVAVDVAAGAPVIPLDDVVMFNAIGGLAIASTTPDGAATEKLTYTGVFGGGAGAIVGPSPQPSVAPTVGDVPGTELGLGTYQYAYTFGTAAGESVPSPVAIAITTGGMTDPPAAPIAVNTAPGAGPATGSFSPIGETQQYVYTYSPLASFSDFTQQTLPSPASPVLTTISNADPLNPTQSAPVRVTLPFSPDSRIQTVFVYQKASSVAGGLFRHLAQVVNNPTGGTFSFTTYGMPSATSARVPPATNTTPARRRVLVNGISLGPTGTTHRKVYRTAVDAAQLKLLFAIFDNTTTTGTTDSVPDGSLGANAPATDTSGLPPPTGQVNAGSTSILLSSAAPFLSPAGWAQPPNGDPIHYTGISGNTLTGIPAAGVGSILTTINYGDPLVPAPVLTGVSGNAAALARGAPLYLWVQRDHLAAQAAAAARESTDAYASDGIHEHTLVDERRGEPSLTALCDADLQLFGYPLVTVTYATRDVKTKSGRPIVVDLPTPAIAETLTITEVTISEIDIVPGLAPRFAVTASSVRWSLEDLLRRLSGLVEV